MNQTHSSIENKENYAQHLLKQLGNYLPKTDVLQLQTEAELPRVIWMLWSEGLECAPDVVKLCHQSWVKFNPDYKVKFLNYDCLTEIINVDILKLFSNASIEMGPVQRSDFLRYFLLNFYGGVWVEATALCLKPLSSWIDDEINKVGFFCFRQPNTAPDRQFISWFLASKPKNTLINMLFKEVFHFVFKARKIKLIVGPVTDNREYLETGLVSPKGTGYEFLDWRETHGEAPYFWTFYLFNEVAKQQPELWKHICTGGNNYSQPYYSFDRFINSYVSKQTYKDDYENSNLYQQRKAYILDPLSGLN